MNSNNSLVNLKKSDETKEAERLVNDRVSKLSEQQQLAFRRINSRAVAKILALDEIDYEWRLINEAEHSFGKQENKRKLTIFITLIASALILSVMNISLTEKGVLLLFVVLWIGHSVIEDMNVHQNILLKKAILKTALVNLRSDIRECGVFEPTADSYRHDNKMCIESEGNSEPIRNKFYNDLALSRINIQSEILDSL